MSRSVMPLQFVREAPLLLNWPAWLNVRMALIAGSVVAFPVLQQLLGLDAAVGLALGIVLVALLILRPDISLASTLAVSVIFARQFPLPRAPMGIRFIDLALAILLLWWIAQLSRKEKERVRSSSRALDCAILVFLGMVVLGALQGFIAEGQRSQALVELFRILPLALYFPATFLLARSSVRWRVLWWVVVAGAIASAWSVNASLTGGVTQLEVDFRQLDNNLAGRYGDILRPNQLTSTNYFAILPVLVLLLGSRSGRMGRLVLAACLILAASALVVDLNRTRWLEAGLALVLWWILRRPKPAFRLRHALGVGPMAIVLLATLAVTIQFAAGGAVLDRVAVLDKPLGIGGVVYRMSEGDVLLDGFLRAPVLGQGLGWSYIVLDPVTNLPRQTALWHNDFLFALAKLGIGGFAAFVAVMFIAMIEGWHVVRCTTDESTRMVVGAMVAILVSSILPTLTHSSILSPDYVAFVAFALAEISVEAQRCR